MTCTTNQIKDIHGVEIPENECATLDTLEELTNGKGEDDGYEQ